MPILNRPGSTIRKIFTAVIVLSVLTGLYLAMRPSGPGAKKQEKTEPGWTYRIAYETKPGFNYRIFSCDKRNFYTGIDTLIQDTIYVDPRAGDSIVSRTVVKLERFDLADRYLRIRVVRDENGIDILRLTEQPDTIPPDSLPPIVMQIPGRAWLMLDSSSRALYFIGTDDVEYAILEPCSVLNSRVDTTGDRKNPNGHSSATAPYSLGSMMSKRFYNYLLDGQGITLHYQDTVLYVYSYQSPSLSVQYDSPHTLDSKAPISPETSTIPRKRDRRTRKE